MSAPTRRVPGMGPRNAKIALVGEAPGAHEDQLLKPFVGPAGKVLEECLHNAGLIRNELWLTNVVKVRPPKNDISPFFNGKTFSAAGMEYVNELRNELDELSPNIIVACGKTALAAITGKTEITKFRGYVFETIGLKSCSKCIPCIHPAACLYPGAKGSIETGGLATKSVSPYLYRYIITCDLKKAKLLSESPALHRPERQLIYNYSSVEEVSEWLEYFAEQNLVSFDIEVLNYEVSCISFSATPDIAASIPIAHSWTELEEAQIWIGIQKILGNENIVKVGQNLSFDIHFLLTRCGIETRGAIQDTMIAHSIVFPELPKSLGFLGSIYCGSQEFWKDLVSWKGTPDIKENS